ncbi:hypothetical protein L596_030727 [Steinernema carpocapsae]|uniref:Uncharacterized protein n=1 Tax=Steinernema carpocapsae TaxID=34508 RepID=A0A4V6XVJ5_STECR|nr:hypothetical protein L596_030727 [Steinernema carpocapsae]
MCDSEGEWSQWTSWEECSQEISVVREQSSRSRECISKPDQPMECIEFARTHGLVCDDEEIYPKRIENRDCPQQNMVHELFVDNGQSRDKPMERSYDDPNSSSPQPYPSESIISNTSNCGLTGTWSEWSEWEDCPNPPSKNASKNVRERYRSCKGIPDHCRPTVGYRCSGEFVQYAACSFKGLPRNDTAGHLTTTMASYLSFTTTTVPGKPVSTSKPMICRENAWEDWTEWNKCPMECGNCGKHQRTRLRLGKTPEGFVCQPSKSFEHEKRVCNPSPCVTNGTKTCCDGHKVAAGEGVTFICVPK